MNIATRTLRKIVGGARWFLCHRLTMGELTYFLVAGMVGAIALRIYILTTWW